MPPNQASVRPRPPHRTHLPTQARSLRSPPPLLYTRPWRSSPLAAPAFSTLPPIISESSEDEMNVQAARESARQLVQQSRAPSPSSITSSYGTSTLLDSSTSSVSLPAPALPRPARLSKSAGRRASSVHSEPPFKEPSIVPPPRARTISHGSRPLSHPPFSTSSSSMIPPTYSRRSPPHPDVNNPKQPPSVSRDPSANWMSTSPFGPAETPRFSRLAMASPAVVMPLSAKEYRKRKAKEVTKEKGLAFTDNATTAFQDPGGLPLLKVSSPSTEDVHRLPSDRPSSPQPRPPSNPSQSASLLQPLPRARSRPNTPPRSSPLAVHPPISPKSSATSFFSVASSPDDDSTPSPGTPPTSDDTNTPRPRPRPRPRRKSYPDRLSNGARLSLVEAMNRLSQTDPLNRLSVASQASGHTLFYDADDNNPASTHTQSLENLSSTLARTGIEVVPTGPSEDIRAKRNVRVVRISDTVEVSPAPVHRRRKLTKSRPQSMRATKQEHPSQAQLPERSSLLPWRSKVSADDGQGTKSRQGSSSPIPNPSGSIPLVIGRVQDSPKPASVPVQTSGAPPAAPSESSPRRKSRRYTFSLFSSPASTRPKHVTSTTPPASVDLSVGPAKIEDKSSTDSTSTSIRTITQGSESTLGPIVHDLARSASSSTNASMLQRLNTAETRVGFSRTESESTPSLLTDSTAATATTNSPQTPSFGRLSGEPFVHRPSALKEMFTELSDDRKEATLDVNACAGRLLAPLPGSRPGTSSSTLTTATETSGTYASFSTIPVSTISSTSTSRSTSPSLGDKERAKLRGEREKEDGCVLCGHVPVPSVSTQGPTHPMFTVPLVTVPARAVGGHHVHVNGQTRAKKRRPQTAPAGSGDLAFQLCEEKQAESVPKTKESKIKSMLKGLLRRKA